MKQFSHLIYILLILCLIPCVRADWQVQEMRGHRAAGHFRSVAFAPDRNEFWAVGFNGCVLVSADGGETWTHRQVNPERRLYCVQISPGLVTVCGSSGAVYQFQGDGIRKLPAPTALRLTAVHFLDPHIGWVCGDRGAIFHTDNAGETWTLQTSGVDSGLRSIWFKDSQLGFCVGYDGVVLETEDGGRRWRKLQVPPNISIYGSHFSHDGERIFLTGSFGMILESRDRGRTWKMHSSSTTNFMRDIIVTDDGHGVAVGYGWILLRDGTTGEWRKHWPVPGFHLQGVSAAPGGRMVAVGRWGACFVSADSGETWQFQTELFSPDIHDLTVSAVGHVIAACADGHILTASGSGEWTAVWTGLPGDLNTVATAGTSVIITAGTAGQAARSVDGGQNWIRFGIGGKAIRSLWFISDEAGFAAGHDGSLFRTRDGGGTWTNVSLSRYENILGIQFINPGQGWAFGAGGLVMETRDGGSTWIAQYTGIQEDLGTGYITPDGPGILISETGRYLQTESWGYNSAWELKSAGVAWLAVSPDLKVVSTWDGGISTIDGRDLAPACPDRIRAFAAHPNVPGTVWGAGENGRVIRLADP